MIDAEKMKSAHTQTVVTILIPFCLWALLSLIIPYSAFFDILLKIALWGIPAYFFPRLADRVNPNGFLLLNKAPQWKWIFLSAIFLVGYSFLINIGKIEVKSISAFYFVAAVVISPIAEEVAFRGVVLQRLNQHRGFMVSNAVTAVLFMLYHIPLWFTRGTRHIHAGLFVGGVFFLVDGLFFCINQNPCGPALSFMLCRICFLGYCDPTVYVWSGAESITLSRLGAL
jgi:membrane protease YdiL (CAAX protease family)